MSTEHDNRDDDGALVVDRPPAEERKDLAPPPKYAVVFLNDDYTPMDFVVGLLMKFFKKSQEEAAQITLDVHEKGEGLAGVYPKDIAETKAVQVVQVAQANGHPFRADVKGLH